ncbi:general transcription and DNA repair factor IIH helicase subunit XPB-like [Penaeus japonicus]|uniref:general transcription and DNA repair factor IIH helicase subunit XPB-like n=1 Tax=Penaeus japonicus TaxID=27405 RepID=UPI001C7107A8|nr:general transcription and DNA repair factor IIH helicase subunit XPB-like [Penaeus japonicus]
MPRGFLRAIEETGSASLEAKLSSINPNKFLVLRHLLDYFGKVDKKVLIFFERIFSISCFALALNCNFIIGSVQKNFGPYRQKIINQFREKRGAMNLMVTRIADTGLDIPDLAVAVQIDGLGASRQQEVQRVGRLQRQKKNAVYYNIFSNNPREASQTTQRAEYMRSLGYDVEHMSHPFCVSDSDEVQEKFYRFAMQCNQIAYDQERMRWEFI